MVETDTLPSDPAAAQQWRAEKCSKLTDREMAIKVFAILIILARRSQNGEQLLTELTSIVGDIRAGERLRSAP
jgi:hypothetical protein